VADLRSRFRLPARELRCDDRFILLRTPRRALAVVADSVDEIRFFPSDSTDSAKRPLPPMEYLQGVAVLNDGLVLINDLDRLLSLDEETALDAALTGGG
jgi:purine-binding chemotaxis protein CheW